MSDNIVLGSSPIPDPNTSQLSFHQYIIYDRAWVSGTVKFDAITGNFYIEPDPSLPPETLTENKPVFNKKNIFNKNK